MASSSIVPFASLPLDKNGPRGNVWGLFPSNPDIGMLNHLTSETTIAAAREIIHGIRICTDLPLDFFKQPCFGRVPFKHEIIDKSPRFVNDDFVAFNTQSASQWDGFRHYAYQDAGLWFGGRTRESLKGSNVIGIGAWVKSGGIVGRGVLLDYAAWAEKHNIKLKCFDSESISVKELDLVLQEQQVELKKGDILFIRTGWTEAFEALDTEERAVLVATKNPPSIGIESSAETLEWIWNKGLAAIAGDQPAIEAWPCQDKSFWLHEWLLAGWGMPIGELFDLRALSVECRKRSKWSFFFSSVPIHVPGGVASPPNGVAIL